MKLTNNIVIRNLREWLTLAFIIFGFIYLTGDSQTHDCNSARSSNSAQIALESAESSQPVSNDVSGSDHPVNQSSMWVAALDVVSLHGKSSEKKFNSNSQFANQSPQTDNFYSFDYNNTLSLVSSELASSFTLVGQKPSGTS